MIQTELFTNGKKGAVMRSWLLVFALVMFVFTANAQIENIEATFSWEDQTEVLTPEEGTFPPDREIQSTTTFGRLRFQDRRGFPVYEFRFARINPHLNSDVQFNEYRAAMLQPLPGGNWYIKALGELQETIPTNSGSPVGSGSAYLIGRDHDLQFALGGDVRFFGDDEEQVNASLRAKYDIGKLQLMGGFSSIFVEDRRYEEETSRFTGGAVYKLPHNFMIGGSVGSWEDELGYSFNIGRYNDFGKNDGAPSFALNYLQVPAMYKWTNFRIMWGDRPGHYVLPTFINPVFGGMHDLNTALMLQELVPDNYRHFDTPLIFRRYDEYGKYAIRVNYIETPSTFRKFDANFSTNTGHGIGIFEELRSIFTVERIHNPGFKWQDNRYHVTGAAYLFGKVYSGVTYSTDMDEFNRVMVEFRVISGL
jgi:hypothetical protein